MSVSEPGKIITPWAESGLKNPIPPAANPATGRAGFDQGFSAINMTAKEAGGIPPFGQDFNGIFYEVTNILRYMQAGGQPTFDAALATAIGGYPKGAMVLGSDGVTLWQSQVVSNSDDPDSSPANWGKVDVNLKSQLGSTGGFGLVFSEIVDVVVKVPSDKPNLQSAVDFAHHQYKTSSSSKVVVSIESTFQVETGVFVRNGDYSNIEIQCEDSELLIPATFPVSSDFISVENGAGPVLGCLVNANGRVGVGYRADNRATAFIKPGCGVKNTYGSGLVVRYGSLAYAHNTIWTGAAQGGGQTSGILSWAAGVSAEGAMVSNSLHYGAQSAHGGWLSFRAGKANNCSRYGIRATDGGIVDADGAEANECGLNGIRAFNLGIINFRDGKATGCGDNSDAASGSISASYGSIVNAVSADLSLPKYQAVIALNSTVTVTLANMSGAYRFGINAQGASNVAAGSSDVSGAGASGIQAIGSVVHCPNVNANNCAAYGISALDASVVNASGAQAKSCGTGGMTSRDGSTLNAKGSDTSGTLAGNCLFAWSGTINATDAIAQAGGSPASTDIRVFEGGEISANAGTVGGLSQAANAVTANGIIFK
ncbi:MAG: hypothetical protein ACRC7D_22410 [Aeromonas popoffii]|uniref:hypothetical protein n=1 Tax=Aeromonas popoffii TaxID=70856 RepID=UPI003F37E916